MAIWDIKQRYKKARANQTYDKGDRGLFAGDNPEVATVDYVNIAANGVAADFGDLTAPKNETTCGHCDANSGLQH